MSHKIYPYGRQCLVDIWRYTNNQWGEEQANKYVIEVYQTVEKAAKNRSLWRPVPHSEADGVFFIRYKRHYIFFKQLSQGNLGVLTILHESMNIPDRLQEALDKSEASLNDS